MPWWGRAVLYIQVWQVRTYGYPDDALARRMEDGAKVTEAQWWDYYQMNQRP
jgi:hypothetical protein